MIVKPADNIVERFDLATRKLQLTAHQESEQPLTLVSMGYASHGPVLLGFAMQIVERHAIGSTIRFLDLKTLKPLDVEVPRQLRVQCDRGTMIRPSADGTVFGMWRTNVSPAGVAAVIFLGDRIVQNLSARVIRLCPPQRRRQTRSSRAAASTTRSSCSKKAASKPPPCPFRPSPARCLSASR